MSRTRQRPSEIGTLRQKRLAVRAGIRGGAAVVLVAAREPGNAEPPPSAFTICPPSSSSPAIAPAPGVGVGEPGRGRESDEGEHRGRDRSQPPARAVTHAPPSRCCRNVTSAAGASRAPFPARGTQRGRMAGWGRARNAAWSGRCRRWRDHSVRWRVKPRDARLLHAVPALRVTRHPPGWDGWLSPEAQLPAVHNDRSDPLEPDHRSRRRDWFPPRETQETGSEVQ